MLWYAILRIKDLGVFDPESGRASLRGVDHAEGLSGAPVDIVNEAVGRVPRVVEIEVVEERRAGKVALKDVLRVGSVGGEQGNENKPNELQHGGE